MMQQEVTVTKKEGVLNKDAAALVQRAMRYDSEIYIEQGTRRVNCKSIMGVLSLGLKHGGKLTIIAAGKDDKEAVADLVRLVGNGFVI
ncbi:MAG: HPr family phosphocarrier protein [Clostridiales bacterium]|jgi:catabolite repression HPr-like protein|nr:HPr family phosphocarrier protein [Clostridiales bacterium]